MWENKRRREQYRGRSGHSLAMWWVERGRPVSSDKAIRGNLKGLAVCCFFPFFHHFLQCSYSRGHGQLWQTDKEIRGLISVCAEAVGSTVREERSRQNKQSSALLSFKEINCSGDTFATDRHQQGTCLWLCLIVGRSSMRVSSLRSPVSLRWEQMLLIGRLSSPFMNVKTHISKEPRDSLTSLTKVQDIKN